ncbi:MAG: transporter [Cyanobacteria bacterium]|nr:transporter [Cyanobacteriota bacterium]MDA1020041.1 transporter [Cyanobacteriota bacterium]
MNLVRLLFVLFCVTNSLAIGAEPISFERGGISDSPGIVRPKSLQLEFGLLDYTNTNQSSYTLGTSLFRYGLIQDRFELRFLGSGLEFVDDGLNFNHIAPGFKVNLLKEQRHLPSLDLISHVAIPLDGNFAHFYKFLINKELKEKLKFLTNLSLNFDNHQGHTDSYLPYVFDLNYELNAKLSALAEVFGTWSMTGDAGNPLGLAYGFTYLLSDDTGIDFTNFYGLNESAADIGISFGMSHRF